MVGRLVGWFSGWLVRWWQNQQRWFLVLAPCVCHSYSTFFYPLGDFWYNFTFIVSLCIHMCSSKCAQSLSPKNCFMRSIQLCLHSISCVFAVELDYGRLWIRWFGQKGSQSTLHLLLPSALCNPNSPTVSQSPTSSSVPPGYLLCHQSISLQ